MSQEVPKYAVIADGQQIALPSELARLLQCDSVDIHKDERGRPFLTDNENDVNWSHSGELLAIAWSSTKRVGVDIEKIRPRDRWLRIAGRFFAESELADLEKQDSLIAFLKLWCLKEAVIKAHGHGISYGMEKVLFRWDGGWKLQALPGEMGKNWHAELIDVPEGYIGALAWRDR